MGNERVVAETSLSGVSGVVEGSDTRSVGVVLHTLRLYPLPSNKPCAPYLVGVLNINLEVGVERVEDESGKLSDVIVGGKVGDIDPHIFAEQVGEMYGFLPSNPVSSVCAV